MSRCMYTHGVVLDSNMIQLNSGASMPTIGVGTYQIRDATVIDSVIDAALDAGYRLIDTAQVYGNEHYIGDALTRLLPKYSLSRQDVFIISKLSPAAHGRDKATNAIIESLAALRTDYIDLMLIHWPGASRIAVDDPQNVQLRTESWQCLQQMHDDGKLKSIGVSNYNIAHLEQLLESTRIIPAVNQCEFHPHYADRSVHNFCQRHSIHFQAYSSLGSPKFRRNLFDEKLVIELAKKYNCSPAQLLLAWSLHLGISVLPRSTNPMHVRENIQALNVSLTDDDVAAIGNIRSTQPIKYCWDSKAVL